MSRKIRRAPPPPAVRRRRTPRCRIRTRSSCNWPRSAWRPSASTPTQFPPRASTFRRTGPRKHPRPQRAATTNVPARNHSLRDYSESAPGRTSVREAAPHHVVIVGAGFGGLAAVHGLAGVASRPGLRITIVDQRNHHLFQPLLYQVGTAVLATSEIAWPIRHLLRRRKEVTTLLAVVGGIDIDGRNVLFE